MRLKPLSTLLFNFLFPGMGYFILQKYKMAVLHFMFLIGFFFIACWTNLIFSSTGLKLIIPISLFINLVFSVHCFKAERKINYFFLRASIFLLISLGGLFFVFSHKEQLLGVAIYFIPSNSMTPTLEQGDFILIDTWSYKTKNPSAGDVVVFKHAASSVFMVKRVSAPPKGPQQEKKYFLLGDNQSDSMDSRHFGFIDKEAIQGKVKLILISFNYDRTVKRNRILISLTDAHTSTTNNP